MSQDLNFAWNGIRPMLKKFSFADIKEIIGLAQFDLELLSSVNLGDKEGLLIKIETEIWKYYEPNKLYFLNIVLEEMLNRDSSVLNKLEYYLSRLGWNVVDNKIIPIDFLDRYDLDGLDDDCKTDLIKSATRFRGGDLDGAIASACAAVDAITNNIYRRKSLGEIGKTSFQERCKKSLNTIDQLSLIDQQLEQIGWDKSDSTKFKSNLTGSLNQAAYVMQSLRKMSDVHGSTPFLKAYNSRPFLKALVFDSIKWSQILVRLLSLESSDKNML